MNRYIDILTKNATPIARITCFGLLLLVAMSGLSSARAANCDYQTCTRKAQVNRTEQVDPEVTTNCFGQKPTRARRRWSLAHQQ